MINDLSGGCVHDVSLGMTQVLSAVSRVVHGENENQAVRVRQPPKGLDVVAALTAPVTGLKGRVGKNR